ncbi:MAG: sigma 54-interacting transcriptional regulator [Spirochaetia bacterium]|nr:sigma 54-interacting transcriptional regulator [Spirochaetia bacterium]
MLRDHLEHPEHFAAILTMDRQLISLFTYIESISRTDLPVLITGEVGSGKTLFAEAVHLSSGLRGEFVRAEAVGLGPDLLKPLLFGFSEGGKANGGLVEKAVGGSLYIDEIGETDLDTQGRILHLLQDGKTAKRDPTRPRLIASTRHDLKVRMDKGQFRKDLFFRLRPHIIEVPPLRARKGDIPLLADHFLTLGMEVYGKDRRPVLERSVLDLLKEHEYDGNVRELKDILFAAMGEEKGNRIREDRIRKIISRNLLGQVYAQSGQHDFLLRGAGGFPTFKQAEEILIREAMGRSNNKQTHAAKLLGISRQALNKRLKSKPFNSSE